MQQNPLLATKLHIPLIRHKLVSRPRLIERLNAGLPGQSGPGERSGFARKLTLVSAPAGFGKTTLVSDWVHHLRLDAAEENQVAIRIAWLSLDESDNDPTRFLVYFVAALQTIGTNIGKGALSALQSPQPPPTEVVLTSLINEIAAIPDRIVLVLDDYQLIEAQPIHDTLTFLLEHLPPQMHLVVATREDPQLSLARLRARGQMTELRATDLRFTSSEAAEFLNQVMRLDLSEENIAALETRTEGWITGLQLAAISMQGRKDATSLIRSFTGSHRFVLDYLVEEVLQQQSESVQAFLLQTAVLGRLTGSLCDAVRFGTPETPSSSFGTAVTKQDNGQEILEMLEHANLFIVPLDNERRWYRYHHLFSDLLRQRLRQRQSEQPLVLHSRASVWYEQNGFAEEAIQHALRAEDFERVAHLLEEHLDALWQRGEYANCQRWLAGLPGELAFAKPELCILHAWDLFLCGQYDAAERSLQVAEQALEASSDGATGTLSAERGQLPGSDRMKIQGRAAAIRAWLASFRGDVQGVTEHSRRALQYLPEQDFWRSTTTIAVGDAYGIKGDIAAAYQTRLLASEMSKETGHMYLILIANLGLAETLRQQGKLKQVADLCKQQMQYANECGMSQTVAAGWLLAIWGEVLAELNNLDLAIHQATKGVALTERGGRDVQMVGWSNLCLVRVLFSRGDMIGAEEIIQKMENTLREYDMPLLVPVQISAWQARIWLEQDELEAASRWAAERGLDVDGELPFLREVEYVVLARILIAQGRLDEATRLLHRLLEAAEMGGHTSRVIENMMLQALTSQAMGDTTQAITTLEKALTLAEPGGFVRIFVDEGPPMARLLYEAAARGIATDYVRQLLAAFPIAEPRQTGPSRTQAPESELIESLSERELEVLQLIAEGLTNPEIASDLYLALNTVKAHTRNIYGKLGAHSRTQAVARARALGVLPST